ncbi:MAG TPA: hypothetical protein GX510_05860 [Firmicutes bacterium]|nr:hypothetical protein [Candidatus Fermentithermobacillaceae bacterium]
MFDDIIEVVWMLFQLSSTFPASWRYPDTEEQKVFRCTCGICVLGLSLTIMELSGDNRSASY